MDRRCLALTLIFILQLPTVMAGWGSPGAHEPDTREDQNGGSMWATPDTSDNNNFIRAYFAVAPLQAPIMNANVGTFGGVPPTTTMIATLAVWKDCNRDGIMGYGEAGLGRYRRELLENDAVCPVGGPFNDDVYIQELIPIGPACGDAAAPAANCVLSTAKIHHDPAARVWGDDGLPGFPPACRLADAPDCAPRLRDRTDWTFTFINASIPDDPPVWIGTRTGEGPWNVDASAQYQTFYASTHAARDGVELPMSELYGADCSRYECDGARWWDGDATVDHRVRAGQSYHLRDVDCDDSLVIPLVSEPCARAVGGLARYVPNIDEDRNGIGDAYQRAYGLTAPLQDLDGDGASNLIEFRWSTIPVFGTSNAMDYDMDGWLDGPEIEYWDVDRDDIGLSSVTLAARVALTDPDAEDDLDHDGKPNHKDNDSDDDGLWDGDEIRLGSYPEFIDSDCALGASACTPANESRYRAADRLGAPGTGDGMPDGIEHGRWLARVGTLLVGDMDGDGIESVLLDPDVDGDGIPDPAELIDGATLPHRFDTDGDGLLDGADLMVARDDARYEIFADAGIVYRLVDGGRVYLGEVSQGTDPLDPDSDGDGVLDGDEVDGERDTRASAVRERVADADPQNEALPYIPPEVDAWIRSEKERTWMQANLTGDHVVELLEDPAGFFGERVEETTTLLPPPFHDIWTDVESGVNASLTCIADITQVERPTDHVGCLASALEGTAFAMLDTITDAEPASFPDAALSTVEKAEALVFNTLPFTPVIPSPPDVRVLGIRPVDLGPGSDLPTPWSRENLTGTPVAGLLWGEILAPTLTADVADTLGARELFDAATLSHRLGGPDIIPTLDSGTYNILIQIPGQESIVRRNVPIGTTCRFVFATQTCATTGEADLEVTGRYSLASNGRLAPEFSFARNVAGLDVLVAIYMQIPDAPTILALGIDGRAIGLPPSASVTVATDAEGAARIRFGTQHAPSPARILASAFDVDTAARAKPATEGPYAHLAVHLSRLPQSATLDVAMTPDLSVVWASTLTTDLTASFIAGRSHDERRVAADFKGIPTSLRTTLQAGEGLAFQHAAAANMPSAIVGWERWVADAPQDMGRMDIRDMPAAVSAAADLSTRSVTFDASAPLGRTHIQWSNASEMACGLPEGAEGIALRRFDSLCVDIDISAWRSAQVVGGEATRIAFRRDTAGPPTYILFETPEAGLLLDASHAPAALEVSAATTPAGWRVVSTLDGPMDRLVVGARAVEMSFVLRAAELPRALEATVGTDGSLQVDLKGARLADLEAQVTTGAQPPRVSLGANDGVIFAHTAGGFAGALRLRELRGATAQTSAEKLAFHADTGSERPFHIRWRDGESYLDADLPRLPAAVTVDLERAPNKTSVRYRASEPLELLQGGIQLGDSTATVYVDIAKFPREMDIDIDHLQATYSVRLDDAVERMEIALLDGSHELTIPDAELYLEIDDAAQVQTPGGTVAQFHFAADHFVGATITQRSEGIQLDTQFERAPRSTLAHVRDKDGWFQVRAIGELPPTIRLDVTPGQVTWNATPEHELDLNGWVDRAGLAGNWTLAGLGANAQLVWRNDANVTEIRLDHDSDALSAAAELREATGENAWNFALQATDVPPHVALKIDAVDARLQYTATDAHGAPRAAAVIAVGIGRDDRLPDITSPGQRFKARLTPELEQVEIRIEHLEHLDIDLGERPNGTRHVSYRAAERTPLAIHIDRGMEGEFILSAPSLPQRFDAIARVAADVATLNLTASEAYAPRLFVGTRDTLFDLTASMPTQFDLTVGRSGVQLRADGPSTIEATLASNDRRAPSAPAGAEHVLVTQDLDRIRGSLSIQGARHIELTTGRIHIERDQPHDLLVNVPHATGRIHVSATQLPPSLAVGLKPNGTLTWRANAVTPHIRVDADTEGTRAHIIMQDVPMSFDLDARQGAVRLVAENDTIGKLHADIHPASGAPPSQEGDGVTLEFGTTAERPIERLALRLTDVRAIVATQQLARIERNASGLGWGIHIRNAAGGFDVQQDRTPAVIEITTTPDRRHVTINASEPLGTARAIATLAGATIAMEAQGLPGHIELVHGGTSSTPLAFTLDANGPTARIHGNFTTGGARGRFDLQQVPQHVSITHDAARGTATLDAPGGMTGTLVAQTGAGAPMLPPNEDGATISLVQGSQHIALRVTSLENATWTRSEDGLGIGLRHAGGTRRPLHIVAEGDVSGSFRVDRLPAELAVRVEGADSIVYDASDPIGQLDVTLADRTAGLTLVATATDIPQHVSIYLNRTSADDLTATAYAQGDKRPTVDATLQQGTTRSRLRLEEIPARTVIRYDAAAPDGCMLDIHTTSPLGRIVAQTATGAYRKSNWLREGTQWLGIDNAGNGLALDADLSDIGNIRYCPTSPTGFHAEARLGEGDWRISYVAPGGGIQARLDGVEAGNYAVRLDRDGAFGYEGAGTIERLELHDTLTRAAFLGRRINSLSATVTNIPETVTGKFAAGRLALDSEGGSLGDVVITGRLSWASNEGAAGGVGGPQSQTELTIEAGDFAAASLRVEISDANQMRWPGDETQRVVYRDHDREKSVGISVTAFEGIRGSIRGGRTELTKLGLPPGTAFRLLVDAADVFTIVMPEIAEQLVVTYDQSTIARVRLHAASEIDLLRISTGLDEFRGLVFEVAGVPAGHEITLESVRGKLWANVLRLDSLAAIDRVVVGEYRDATHYWRFVADRVSSLDSGFDLDGAAEYEGNPKIFWIDKGRVDDFYFESRDGDRIIVTGGHFFGAVALAVWEVTDVAVEAIEGAKEVAITVSDSAKSIWRGSVRIAEGAWDRVASWGP